MATKSANVETLSFESALEELEAIIRNLETGKTSLEQSIESYERGIALKTHCETKLREARMKIEKIVVGSNGTLSTQPLDQ
ncbi:MAG: exodeoxyribonuclease VII small subunit [Alphaproteobacteria bacterium]|jgi:exodeoxyribonuclease VII small subunit|nr:exodeoxyribonuclease VII small subunit [Alphaproteobacteria bacterium]MCB1551789.1 exodeoxyribonuclease VII small subunit [Alphaproteobacteria bacterium]MCB9984994.1 exodeoxyribonuclease VII small subunit [Micavibrio sp.]HPQ50290.1 exodeoxyribonuclease VII small subunit [Alphaproteobacteria bacterium]HRK97385.1 exodeoxyribonuclease VII small subunit [Alphaproteobacteria bacterium]